MGHIHKEEHICPFSICKKERHDFVYHMPANHYHETYEIYYLLEGSRRYFIEDCTYHIQKGDVVLIDKNVIHRTLNDDNPRHTKIMIQFKEDYLRRDSFQLADTFPQLLQCFQHQQKIIRLDLKQQHIIESLLSKTLSESHTPALHGHLYTELCLIELLLILNRYQDEDQDHPHHFADHDTLHSKIRDIIKFITGHYYEPLTLTSLSDHFFISPNYLCKIFKETTGFTFISYLNQYRIKEAQRLLRKSDDTISTIGMKVGFQSPTHFGRVFKHMVGTTPLSYRNKSNH